MTPDQAIWKSDQVEKLKSEKSETIQRSLHQAEILNRRQAKLSKRIQVWSERLEKYQTARLVAGGIFFLTLVILTIRSDFRFELPTIVFFLILFWWLIVRTRQMQGFLTRLERLRMFFARQENRCRGLPSGANWDGAERLKSEFSFIGDLGIFGSHSLCTLLNETLTDEGEKRLLSWLCSPPSSVNEIRDRQQKIQKLRRESWFFTRLGLEADRESFRLSSGQILDFLQTSLVEPKFPLFFGMAWSVWIAAVIGILVSNQFGLHLKGLFIFIFAVTDFLVVNKVGNAFKRGTGLAHHLNELAPVFSSLEKRTLKSDILQKICPEVSKAGPSREAKKLNRSLSYLSVQANPLVFLILNALVPWTLTAAFFLELRRKKMSLSFPKCLHELAELEALGSLLILDRYQTRNYPTLVEDASGSHLFSFQSLFHPLIEREKVISNDFSFPNSKSLGLLTGSNMSGKSTFLRSCGINQLLANIGAPVFAEEFTTSPLQIETCIEVSDSLRDGFSYFYAEVRRLKSILEVAQSGKPVLFLVDEIFRGTNNRERQIGSQAVIRSLAQSAHALGFVSTHDLELTELEKQYPSVLNLHFREHINERGEMVFSYRLHPGPSPTTNALIIMSSEGIDVSGLEVLTTSRS